MGACPPPAKSAATWSTPTNQPSREKITCKTVPAAQRSYWELCERPHQARAIGPPRLSPNNERRYPFRPQYQHTSGAGMAETGAFRAPGPKRVLTPNCSFGLVIRPLSFRRVQRRSSGGVAGPHGPHQGTGGVAVDLQLRRGRGRCKS